MTQQLALVTAPPVWSRSAGRGAPLLAVSIPIAPHPKEHRTGAGGRARYLPAAYKAWRDSFAAHVNAYSPPENREPIRVPVAFQVTLVYARPAEGLPSHVMVRGTRVPVEQGPGRVHYLRAADYDNALGGVFDGLVLAGVLLDDRLCVEPVSVVTTPHGAGPGKWWGAVGESSAIEIRLWAARREPTAPARDRQLSIPGPP